MFRFLLIVGLFVGVLNADINAGNSALELQESFAKVADKAFKSVVVITIKKSSAAYRQNIPPEIRRFYRRGNPYMPKNEDENIPVGKGSGFFVSEDGYIVTNNHVVEGSSELVVKVKDGREFKAKVIGTDKKTDLAVIKIDSDEKFPALKFADSNRVKVGYWAIAIGAPYDLDYTMTVGVVSQKGRTVGMNVYENYIQTDASINPGNSGGPLLNLSGEVIGVNDFIMTGGGFSKGNIGLGFAISSNMANKIHKQLIKHGEVVRPWLGIAMSPLDDKSKKQFKTDTGVIVQEVFSGNPADKGGIEPGDVILSVGNKKVNSPREVQFAVLEYDPGDSIDLVILRAGKKIDIKVDAGRQKSKELGMASSNTVPERTDTLDEFGLVLEEREDGVYISKILPNSPAAFAALKAGVKVYAINREKVNSVKEAEEAAAKNDDQLLLYIDTGKSKLFLVLSK